MQNKDMLFYFSPTVSEAIQQELLNSVPGQTIPFGIGKYRAGSPYINLLPEGEDELPDEQILPAKEAWREAMLGQHNCVVMSIYGDMAANMMYLMETVSKIRRDHEKAGLTGEPDITVVLPFFDGRQDREFWDKINDNIVDTTALTLRALGANRVVLTELHSQAGLDIFAEYFGEEHVFHITPNMAFAEYIHARNPNLDDVMIGAPDGADKPNDRGIARASDLVDCVHRLAYKKAVGDDTQEPAPLAKEERDEHMFFAQKTHVDETTKILSFTGDVYGKDCYVRDDMSDSGKTLRDIALELKKKGARSVTVMITHGVFDAAALEFLLSEKDPGGKPLIDKLVVTDTIDIRDKVAAVAKIDASLVRGRVDVVSVGSLIGQEIAEVHQQVEQEAGLFVNRSQRTGTDQRQH